MQNLVPRFVVALTGIITMMAGTAMVTLAGLGSPPVSAPVWVATLAGGLTFGGWMLLVNVFFVLAQLALLRRNFPRIGWLQIPVLAIGSLSLDAWMALMGPLTPSTYGGQLFLLFLGIVVLAIGITVEITPNIIYLPGEGLIAAISEVTGVPFSRIKVLSDVVFVTSAVILSLFLFGRVDGVREGTVLAAVFVGILVGWMLPVSRRLATRWRRG